MGRRAVGTVAAVGKIYEGGEPLAEVVRSGFVEGVHRGSVVVLDATGAVVAAAGDVESPDLPALVQQAACRRSACCAPACAWPTRPIWRWSARSHYGEDFHLARVAALLRTAGLDESGAALPAGPAARPRPRPRPCCAPAAGRRGSR